MIEDGTRADGGQVKTEEVKVELSQAGVANLGTNEAVTKEIKETVVPALGTTTTIVASAVGHFDDSERDRD